MDVSGVDFANQLMNFSNPSIQSYSSTEFDDPINAYTSPISHEIAAQSYIAPKERRGNIAGFKLDRELSDRRTAIYSHPKDKRTVTGFRGTVPSKGRDLLTDVNLTLGRFNKTEHSRNAIAKQKEVYHKYGDKHSYHLTGHSLGAMTSRNVHSRLHNTVSSSTGFNTPGSMNEKIIEGFAIPGIRNDKVNSSRVDYINRTDPVSIFHSSHGKKIKKWSHGLSPHDLSQWN